MAGETAIAGNTLALQLMKDNGIDIKDIEDQAPEKSAGDLPVDKPVAPAAAPVDKPAAAPVDKPAEVPAGTPPVDKPADVPLNDDAVKAYLKNRGIEIENIEDLVKPQKDPTPEELAEQKKQLRESAIKFAMDAKKIKSGDLVAYETDLAKSPRDIMYPLLTAQWKKEDDKLTQEELDDRFSDYYKLNLKEDHWERKDRENLMKAQANAYIQNKHGAVLGIENDFIEHQSTIESAKNYNKQVENVFQALPVNNDFSIEVDMEGGGKSTELYKYDFSKESIAAVKEQFLSPDTFAKLGRAGVKDEDLATIVRNALIVKEFENTVKTVARSHANKLVLLHKAGRKGAIPTHVGSGTVEASLPPKRTIADELLEENKR